MKEAIELHLLADCKTRWNSLLQMLTKILLTIYTEMLIGLVNIFERMEIDSVNISVNDSSLLDIDQIMEFIHAKLQENQLIIGKTMHKQHVKRFYERSHPLP